MFRALRCLASPTVLVISALYVSVGPVFGQSEFKRLDRRGVEELQQQLRAFPEIGLSQTTAKNLYTIFVAGVSNAPKAKVAPDVGPKLYMAHAAKLSRPDLVAVGWRSGRECQLDQSAAEALGSHSTRMRTGLRSATGPKETDGIDVDRLRAALFGDKAGSRAAEWKDSQALPTIVQMLQTENEAIRGLLVDMLSDIRSKRATIALAQRALFDLSPEVRQRAVEALKDRPADDYRTALAEGFRWPWAPVAEHAAEAVISLKYENAARDLEALQKEPDAALPFWKAGAQQIREVVKVNHLSNCMLCHAPSLSVNDPVRGRIPIPGEPLPPTYYESSGGIFVRADITYLKQDFSVVQPVNEPDKWPAAQRYDYLLRLRPATEAELADAGQKKRMADWKSPQRAALDFAARELTGGAVRSADGLPPRPVK